MIRKGLAGLRSHCAPTYGVDRQINAPSQEGPEIMTRVLSIAYRCLLALGALAVLYGWMVAT